MREKKNPKEYMVVAKNEAMRAKMPYTLQEAKLAGVVISRIHPFRDEKFQEIKFETKILLEMMNISKNDYEYLYRITEGLLNNAITIKDKGQVLQANIISSALYNDTRSEVKILIDPRMAPYLLQLQKGGFTQFYLSNILGLSSKYSIAMYMFLKSFEVQRCVTKSIEELKFCLGIETHEYQNFKDFRVRVLETAQKELGEKTDIRFEYIPAEKKGKKVIKITFTINWNPDNKTRINQLNQMIYLKEKDLEETKEKRDQVHAAAVESLRQAGIKLKENKTEHDGELPL